MESPSRSASSSNPETFAGFLAALAPPLPAARNASSNDDALADDVATLSYESALKAHSRYKPAPEPPLQPSSSFVRESVYAIHEAQSRAHAPADLKSASITIRMSEAECAQLKQRAAEAGMTISAYLRSCTFEAEALRGQVKEALAQLRAAGSANDKPAAPAVQIHKKRDWLSRILPRSGVQDHASAS